MNTDQHPTPKGKQPFDIDRAMKLVREAVQPYPKAAMFALRDEGYASAFEQLIACLLSVRTYDEVSIVAARRLFARAQTPATIAALVPGEIDELIPDVTFHERKAAQIIAIAKRVRDEFDGDLPCDDETLQSFAGIGPKCAHLALGIACDQQRISVDIHVHRVTNRWGYVATKTPEQTMLALERVLPARYWVEINERLVPFGKHLCTGVRPKCSTCPVLTMCQQVGVTNPR
ncbi:MAG: endonuclease III domain-containing protein [Thermomicrobiales bacterium]